MAGELHLDRILMKSLVWVFCFLLATPAFAADKKAADDGVEKSRNIYKGLMSDSDLYVGEGQVTLDDYAGDLMKAQSAGRERARGNLAEGIRVKIRSVVTDTQVSDGKTSTQKIEAQSQSVAELELENIQYKYLINFPENGKLTTLASLTKEEYQRQMDRRVLAYRPHRALRLHAGSIILQSMEKMNAYDNFPSGLSPQPMVSGAPSQSFVSYGADFYWDAWFVGASISSGSKHPVLYDPTDPYNQSGYRESTELFNIYHFRAGWEYTPWATRLQLVVPLQVEYALLDWYAYGAQGFGVAGGAVARFWASDRTAFDFGVKWHQGLGSVPIKRNNNGYELQFKPGVPALFALDGPEVVVGAIWNGF